MSDLLIDPSNVTYYNRTTEELELFLLFAIVVAGKTAKTQARLLKEFFDLTEGLVGPFSSPFEAISLLRKKGLLLEALKRSNLGQYTRLVRCLSELVDTKLDLRTCSCEQLEHIHGIGFKTSRFFIVHSRPDANYAILDTHILRYIRDEMGVEDAPRSTPGTLKTYLKYEQMFLDHCREKGHTPANFDLQIWVAFSTMGASKL